MPSKQITRHPSPPTRNLRHGRFSRSSIARPGVLRATETQALPHVVEYSHLKTAAVEPTKKSFTITTPHFPLVSDTTEYSLCIHEYDETPAPCFPIFSGNLPRYSQAAQFQSLFQEWALAEELEKQTIQRDLGIPSIGERRHSNKELSASENHHNSDPFPNTPMGGSWNGRPIFNSSIVSQYVVMTRMKRCKQN
jgi:hypothetical protein